MHYIQPLRSGQQHANRPFTKNIGLGQNGISAISRVAIVAMALVCVASSTIHAAGKVVKITGQQAGQTPFIASVTVSMDNPAALDYYRFTVQPKTGSRSRPISARYSSDYLQKRGFLKAGSDEITVPVFGLYADFNNTVTLTFGFVDGRSQESTVAVQTATFATSPYSHPIVVQARKADTTLSYDFILLKNYGDPLSPTMLDTDGEVRWVGFDTTSLQPSLFYKNGVYSLMGGAVLRRELDGEITFVRDFAVEGVTYFHHNFDFGRDGILMEVDTTTDIESTLLEIDTEGSILHRYDMAAIIRKAMIAGGDDPAGFVKPPGDWFHNNAATYRASDNTLIVSSRENFVIALDYDTQEIRWILGGTNKRWAGFPSLRKYLLNLGPDTVVPIGQHALSIDKDRLLLFDNGFQSLENIPTGKSRNYSAPRMYKIDNATRTATEVWHFLNDESVYSPICSSVYSDRAGNYLIDYTTAGPYMFTELLGLDATGSKVFEYHYAVRDFCAMGWNANPIHLEDLFFN